MHVVAHLVLGDTCLLRYIVAFQRGLPEELFILRESSTRYGKTLAQVALERHDLPLLQRVYRAYQDQPLCVELGMHEAWVSALERKFLAALKWLDTLPVIRQQVLDQVAMNAALWLVDEDINAWLLENRPEYKAYMLSHNLRRVVMAGNLELLQWLIANVPDVPITAVTMDAAAEFGHLKIVRYLHENRTEGCTTAAMDLAITSKHWEIVRFLHTHRTEGCTRVGLQAAFCSGSDGIKTLLGQHHRYSQEWKLL